MPRPRLGEMLEYVTKSCRRANVVFMPKAGKKRNNIAKSFRPNRTSVQMKTMEKFTYKHLTEATLKKYHKAG